MFKKYTYWSQMALWIMILILIMFIVFVILYVCFQAQQMYITRWPFVVHLRKRSKAQWSHLQRTTNIVQQILVEDLWMKLYIKIWKLWALYFLTRRFLKIAFWKPNFWPCDLLIQPIRTIWTILVRDHSGTISGEFGQILISVQEMKSFEDFIIWFNLKLWPHGRGQFWPQGLIWKFLVEDL